MSQREQDNLAYSGGNDPREEDDDEARGWGNSLSREKATEMFTDYLKQRRDRNALEHDKSESANDKPRDSG